MQDLELDKAGIPGQDLEWDKAVITWFLQTMMESEMEVLKNKPAAQIAYAYPLPLKLHQ